MKPSHRLAVFDLDGTLVHLEIEFFLAHSIEILGKLGYPHITRNELAGLADNNDFFGFVPADKREELRHTFHEMFDESLCPAPRLLNGTIETLDDLASRGIKITIATARKAQAHELEVLLRSTGLLNYVSIITSRGGRGRDWQDKSEQILSICKSANVTPSAAFMAGDAPVDIISAKKVGMTSIALLSGGTKAEILSSYEPDYLLPDLTHIPALLKV